MRLTDILALTADHGAGRFLEKRGMSPALVVTALQAPSIGHRAAARYHEIANAVDRAGTADPSTPVKLSGWGTQLLGGAAKAKDALKGETNFNPKNLALHIGGAALASGLGVVGASLLKDMMAKAKSAVGSIGQDAARKAVLDQLKKEDPILAMADDKVLMEAYHTMARFAPTLSTDKNAVRSFLRQAVMNGVGPDYMAIKLLADSERSVTGKGKDSLS